MPPLPVIISSQNNFIAVQGMAMVAIEGHDPCALVHGILSRVKETGVSRTRFCRRLIPVEVVGEVHSIDDMVALARPLIEAKFGGTGGPLKVCLLPHAWCCLSPDPMQWWARRL